MITTTNHTPDHTLPAPEAARDGGGGGCARAAGEGVDRLSASAILGQREVFEERAVRYALGLNKNESRAMRKALLQEGDFLIHKKRLYLTGEAVEKLRLATGGPPAKNAPGLDCAQAAMEKKPAEVLTLRVVRSDLKNRRMILACLGSDDPERPLAPLRVRVHDQKNFVRGMEIPAQLVDGYQDLYDLARACPRKRGKW